MYLEVHENYMKNQILQILSKIDDTLPWEDFYRGELCTENVHQGTVFSIIILIGKYLPNKYRNVTTVRVVSKTRGAGNSPV